MIHLLLLFFYKNKKHSTCLKIITDVMQHVGDREKQCAESHCQAPAKTALWKTTLSRH